jgi:hypothetical protein
VLGKFRDAYEDVYRSINQPPPATLIVPQLIPRMLKSDGFEGDRCGEREGEGEGEADTLDRPLGLEPTIALKECLHNLHKLYCSPVPPTDEIGGSGSSSSGGSSSSSSSTSSEEEESMCMSEDRVLEWLTDINLSTDRGSEMRNAMKFLTDNSKDSKDSKRELSSTAFLHCYMLELAGGKFWGVAHDIYVMAKKYGVLDTVYVRDVLPDSYRTATCCDEAKEELFRARFDKIYYSPGLILHGVMDNACTQPIPNEAEPSDHLPLMASFTLLPPFPSSSSSSSSPPPIIEGKKNKGGGEKKVPS